MASEHDFDFNPLFEGTIGLDGVLEDHVNIPLSPGSNDCTELPVHRSPMLASLLGFLKGEQTNVRTSSGDPTLAALNMNNAESLLFEDIESLLDNEEEEKTVTSIQPVTCEVRKASNYAYPCMANQVCLDMGCTSSMPSEILSSTISMAYGNFRATPTTPHSMLQPQHCFTSTSTLFGSRTVNHNVAVVAPTHVAVTAPVKVDAREVSSPDGNADKFVQRDFQGSVHNLVSSSLPLCKSSTCRKRVMPVIGRARRPTLPRNFYTDSMEEKWKEIEEFIHKSEQGAFVRKRKLHQPVSSVVKCGAEDCTVIDDPGSHGESDSDTCSDDVSDSALETSLAEVAQRSTQFFWQYNVQAKGPKGTRLNLTITDPDPHHPSEFEDPVFDINSTTLVGIRHGGKARRGDGNEVCPNPRKLCHIGKLLLNLNHRINQFAMSGDQLASVASSSRKEKNKLASRACRLKKKAQHEANKIKLTGLEMEHNELLGIINKIWSHLKERSREQIQGTSLSSTSESLFSFAQSVMKMRRQNVIAGHTADFVNDIIAKVEQGDPSGGLHVRRRVME